MLFTFKCDKCNKRKFLQEYEVLYNDKVCMGCAESVRGEKKAREEKYQKHLEKKHARKKKARKLADEVLLEEVEMEKRRVFEKGVKTIQGKQVTKEEKNIVQVTKKVKKVFDDKIQQMSYIYDPLLYVHVTVKRIKVIEWRKTKKKILLNKEREIRHTHKGGFSQEKFQSFVDSQKKKAPEWIEQNLVKKGVLRFPYAKIVIEGDVGLKDVVKKVLEKITS
jgi:hypothetical protein